uniref:PHD-type domain-containing protein n=1 Tax=Anopheles minimus TaxID=112268 RepID=A0A182VQW4_9DIPT
MNSGESDLAEIDGRRIQRTASDRQKQQVSTIVTERTRQTACTVKQPVHFYSNHHQHPLAQETNPNGERTTVVRSNDGTNFEHDANAIIMDGSFQQHQHVKINKNRITAENSFQAAVFRGGLNVTSEKYVENSRAFAVTDGNGALEPAAEPLHTSGSAMRDPQESQHRSAPTTPLGEVESGEDDNDCVVVPSTERKVEPLKINLARDREPIRTFIKLTPGASSTPDSFQQLSPTIRDVPSSPKITIKPPKPPQTVEHSLMGLAGSSASSTSSSSLANAEQHHTNNCAGSAVPSYSSIPKLTIKPIINPADDTLACETAPTVGTAASVEQMHIIPKLLIKGSVSSLDASHGRDGLMEPHIVPKLTIRGVNNHNHHHHQQQQQQQHHFAHGQLESQGYSNEGLASAMLLVDSAIGGRGESSGTGSPTPLVPKLTIKMDNHHPHHHHHHHHHNSSLRVKDAPDVTDGGGSVVSGPIPKLHIKTIQQDGPSMGMNNSLSSASGNCSTSTTGLSPVLTSSEGVKLTIKPLPEPPKLPKLTIKTTGLGTIAETSDVSMVSSTSNSFSPKPLPSSATCSSSGEHLQQHLMCGVAGVSQLLQQHHQQQPASPSDQHSNISSSSIPKLTIKPIPPKDASGVQECPTDGSNAMHMRAECSITPTVPKLTIKHILPPVKQSTEDSSSSSEISINSLESSPISSSSISSAPASAVVTTSPPTALRMTIKVPSSASEQQHESNLVGDSIVSALAGNSATTAAAATVVTRLNIKPVLPPPHNADCGRKESGLEGIGEYGKVHAMATSDEGGSTPTSCDESRKPIVIPKVTIKTLANPGSQETEIMSTPKVTLKPIPKPQDENLVTGNLLERHLLMGAGVSSNVTKSASPIATNSSMMLGCTTSTGSSQDAMDSPRIILKINKGSSSTTTTSGGEQLEGAGTDGGQLVSAPPPSGSSIFANELKRSATNAMCASNITSSGSSSVSCASSTSVSASATSSSAGSDPASPSSGGGGDQGELGTLEMKRTKLDHSLQPHLAHQMQGVLGQQQDLLLQTQHQYQLQLQTSTNAGLTRRPISSVATNMKSVSDVIVIDDDSKSENETPRDKDVMGSSVMRLPPSADDPLAINDRTFSAVADGGASVQSKQRRTRGTPRGGAGARQSRRGNGRGAGSGAMAKQQEQHTNAAVSQLLGLLAQDDREEGSSSDCMIVDEPVAPTSAIRERLTLENLLRGSSKPCPSIGGSSFYNVPTSSAGGGGTGSEVEKNGTASNSSIGSVTSSVSSSVTVPASTPAMSGRTPVAGVRMSTRRAAGQLLKEVLANKHQDRDSGVDEARTDGEFGATPSKRPRGRPKKQSVDLSTETNGGGNSNSVDGSIGGLESAGGNNMLLAMAMMGSEDGASLLRNESRGLLGAQSLMEGIMPLPRTPTRTPRTRGRGRGRGRGKANLMDTGSVFGGPILTDSETSPADRNVDPLFIGTPNNIDPTSTDPTQGFHPMFNHIQSPRGGAGSRTRGGRRGPGSRGPRTPRGGRGAAKAAMSALLTAGGTPSSDIIGPFADLTAAQEAATKQLLDALQQQQQQLLLQQMPHSPGASNMTPKSRGRGRGSRGGGTLTGSRRKGTRGSTKAARGRKGLVLESPMLTDMESSPGVSADVKNAIFMTPLAGGLLHVRALKTPKNEIKSNTPPSSAEATPSTSVTPSRTPAVDGTTGVLQVFEEDTRMSGDFNFTTPMRMLSTGDGCLQQNEESQSSYLSSTSVTQDAINQSSAHAAASSDDKTAVAGTANVSETQKDSISGAISASNSNSSSRRNKGKMEVLDSHRAQFTVDLLAEYEWPPPTPGARGADTFMIQEQIAEYLGVKSFKRKYPDLMRRPVDMEERNFILEQGLASEKMCDLGLTAVYASEILDIMCSDYPEKYEEYTRYTREKHFRELSNRQRQQQEAVSAVVAAAPIDRAQLQKEKAIESAASWNCSFNKERRESRRACMDLQTYVVQLPKRQQQSRPEGHQQTAPKAQSTNYPVALVPGQFSEYYTTYTPEELACYPINTILLDPFELQEIVSSERYRKLVAAEEARLLEEDSSSSSSSDSDSDSDDSSSDSSDTSSGSSTSSGDEAEGRSTRVSGSSSSASSCSDNECGRNVKVKKDLKRQQRGRRPSLVDRNVKSTEPSAPVSTVTPVRRSSRTMSAGVPIAPVIVECKEPTDSDDSDVPLIAHAVKKKNNLTSAITATNATIVPPSAGGGKRMQDTVTPVKRPPVNPFMCAVCIGPENKNKYNKPELFVRCSRCRRKAHPSCIGMSSVMYKRVQQYKWQCSECKLCMKCNRKPSAMDSKMVYCDQCDRGYHLACKGLRNLPEGRWHCSICTICGLCGAQTPEGHPNPHLSVQQRQQLAMVAEWTHEYGLNELTNIREHLRTLCVPCVRQRKQSQQSPAATATGSGGGGESTAILNNNNNTEPRKLLAPAQGVSGLAVPGGVISMIPRSS